ncbi:MAG: hypothetical protein MRZ79_12940 [Bacteroidia bacterium]|nr:hypothetical protein [Bacteroidia bacterium]
MWHPLKEKFSTKQNNIFLALLIVGIILQACQKPSGEVPSRELLAGFRYSIQQRFQEGDTLPYSWESLQKVFPKDLEGFETQKSNGGTFSPGQDRFSAVSQFFTGEEGKYVFIKLSDYAADSSAFNFWLNNRHPQAKLWLGESETIIIEDEKEALIHRTSAIRGSRFHIQMATNHPDGKALLEKILNKLKWDHLR